MPVSKINGVNINWRTVGDRGNDAHPWLVMTTGGRRGHDEFIPLAEKIARYGYRVMLHDRRNTGASDILIAGDEGEEFIWTRDMYALLSEQNALPAFFSGSSAGARTSILFTLNYPRAVRGLLLLRVTGGPFAAARSAEQYYGQFIRAAKEGGMAAICAMDAWKERISGQSSQRRIFGEAPGAAIHRRADALERDIRRRRALSGDGREPGAIARRQDTTLVIPGNDNTHSSASGLTAHRSIAGSELHQLPITDQDVPLIPFPDWSVYEPEIARVFADFMARSVAAESQAA